MYNDDVIPISRIMGDLNTDSSFRKSKASTSLCSTQSVDTDGATAAAVEEWERSGTFNSYEGEDFGEQQNSEGNS